jgi:membrane-associated protein
LSCLSFHKFSIASSIKQSSPAILKLMIEIFLHLDTYLQTVISQYDTLTYAFLFAIIFMETGLVVTPFLPGDSLLFAAGALSAIGLLNLGALFVIIFIAAVIGDTVNYHVGKFIGPKIFNRESSFFFNKNHLIRAQEFYDKHGKKTIILARFVPIVRTFAPFVAGIGKMDYKIFLTYNFIGAAIWCVIFIFGGYFFGNLPWVSENISLLMIIIILISFIPIIKEVLITIFKKKEA